MSITILKRLESISNEAIANLDTAIGLSPDSAEIRKDRLVAGERLADSYKWQQEYEQTREISLDLMTQADAAMQKWPNELTLRKTSGDILQLLGEAYYFLDDYDSAIESYQQSIMAYNEVLRIGGPDQTVSSDLSISHWSRGNSLVDTERPREAAIDYQAAIDLVQLSVARDPDDTDSARRLAILRGSNAMALVRSGENDAAVEMMTETNDWFEAQVVADPDTPGTRRSVAVSYHMMADILQYADRNDEACFWYRKTADTWQLISDKFGISDFDKDQPEYLASILEENCP